MKVLKILTVTDLHCVESLYQELVRAVQRHQPNVVAVIGDFLDATGSRHKQLSTRECANTLAALPCEAVVLTRGNHEHKNWLQFERAWSKTGRQMHALHGEAFVAAPLVMVGFACDLGDETAFVKNRPELPDAPSHWLRKVLRSQGPAMRTLWLMHEPPCGTPLTVESGPVSGNQLWNEAIQQFSPWLVVSGHDHNTPIRTGQWHCRIGQSRVINVGQTEAGPLHYTLIEANYVEHSRALPSLMRITAFPQGKRISASGA